MFQMLQIGVIFSYDLNETKKENTRVLIGTRFPLLGRHYAFIMSRSLNHALNVMTPEYSSKFIFKNLTLLIWQISWNSLASICEEFLIKENCGETLIKENC